MAITKKGTKPDLHKAAKGEYDFESSEVIRMKIKPPYLTASNNIAGPQAKPLYEYFLNQLRTELGDENVKDGVFGAMMDVALVNDGPITINLDSDE